MGNFRLKLQEIFCLTLQAQGRKESLVILKILVMLGSSVYSLLGKANFNMPAKDIYHNAVKNALIQEGWIITNDPLHLKWGQKDMYVDLGAKQLLAAEQGTRKIAVEIKSFVSPSEMADLKDAIGGFVLYRAVMSRLEPDRILYLGVRDTVFTDLFEEPIGKLLRESENLNLLVFNSDTERITQWIP